MENFYLKPKLFSVLKKSGFYDKVGSENFCNHIDDALKRASEIAVSDSQEINI